MHHYNFPPFSVGEVGRMGNPGRREIGHGALGERSLLQVMPTDEEFPYTVRVVSEVLESNGSSSQASICAATMSLMAAGVPIKRPVAGVAMGLISTGDLNDPSCPYTILTDIQGQEDHYGDMDFKVSGTTQGITALQMDIKIKGITREIFKQALAQAHKGRMEILENMMSAISEVRPDVSKYAPKLDQFKINPDKIRLPCAQLYDPDRQRRDPGGGALAWQARARYARHHRAPRGRCRRHLKARWHRRGGHLPKLQRAA